MFWPRKPTSAGHGVADVSDLHGLPRSDPWWARLRTGRLAPRTRWKRGWGKDMERRVVPSEFGIANLVNITIHNQHNSNERLLGYVGFIDAYDVFDTLNLLLWLLWLQHQVVKSSGGAAPWLLRGTLPKLHGVVELFGVFFPRFPKMFCTFGTSVSIFGWLKLY